MTTKQLENGLFFRFWVYVIIPFMEWFYNFTIYGEENLPAKSQPAVFITHHTTHSQDIFIGIMALYVATGRLLHGLLHRTIIHFVPLMRLLGAVPGYPEKGLELLKKGESVGVVPGGGEELVLGHENAYQLYWKSHSGRQRCGFAKLAVDADVPVVPIAGRNTEEMLWCPAAWLWNHFQLSKWYATHLVTLPGRLGWCFYQLQISLTFIVHLFFSIPIPVHVGMVIGKPLRCQKDESVQEFAKRCEKELQELIFKVNGRQSTRYIELLKERLDL